MNANGKGAVFGDKGAVSIDFTEFNKLFYPFAEKATPEAAAAGLNAGATLLIRDSIKDDPRVPHAKGGGTLWRSQQIEPAEIKKDEITLVCGFNTKYAAYQHEGQRKDGSRKVVNYTLSGSGPKFLSKKMAENPDRYVKRAVQVMKEKLGT